VISMGSLDPPGYEVVGAEHGIYTYRSLDGC
jgi:hypothetical protein